MATTITFSIPDFFQSTHFNLFFLDLFRKNRQWFYDDVEIGSIYGSFPCIWNGGRYVNGYVSFKIIEETMLAFAKFGIEIRHTFTNPFIDNVNVNDTFGNSILKLVSGTRFKSAVNINSFIMYAHLTKHYPRIRKIWSTTLGITDISKINTLSKKDLLVLNYNMNNNFEYLKQLKYKENLEILVGEGCIDNCPYRQRHYTSIGNLQMWRDDVLFACPFHREGVVLESKEPERELMKLHHAIDIDTIRNVYVPMGFTQFKISGRKEGYKGLAIRYSMYMAKPEYKDTVRKTLENFIPNMPVRFFQNSAG